MSCSKSIRMTRFMSTAPLAYSFRIRAYIARCQECSAEFSFLLRSSSGDCRTTVLSLSISLRKASWLSRGLGGMRGYP
ncbi:hypothetical protein D3C71_1650390 [compost metagenome]